LVDHDLSIVAHPDDDLLFLNPDIAAGIRAGHLTTTVFAVASVMEGLPGYWEHRERGSEEAYAYMAGVDNHWQTKKIKVAGSLLDLRVLVNAPHVRLIFLQLPDNADPRPGVTTLRDLYDGSPLRLIETIDGASTYSKEDLLILLTSIMEEFQVTTIRLQNPYAMLDNDRAGIGGPTTSEPPYPDHPDHIRVAKLAEAAQQGYSVRHTVVRYRNYDIQNEGENLTLLERQEKMRIFAIYAAHDDLIGDRCSEDPRCVQMQVFEPWTARRYFAAPPATAR
jgi:LmbE family N-acetylglucosaminyl deacetylase